jgi:parallel beta-helix repeat protein
MLAKAQLAYWLFLVVLVVSCCVERNIEGVTISRADVHISSGSATISLDEPLSDYTNENPRFISRNFLWVPCREVAEAATSLPFEKGTIFLSAGVYDFTSSVQVNDDTSIFAEDGAKLRFFGNSYLNLTGDNIIVSGLSVEGDGSSSEFGIRAKGNSITVKNCTVDNVGKVGSFGFGITFEYGSKNGLIDGNVVTKTGLDGIHLRGNENTTISNNIVVDSNDDGIASIWGENNLIINNTINREGTINLAGNGIYVADVGTTVQGNNVESTPLNGITAENFQGYQAHDLSIANNTVLNAGMVIDGIHFGGILLNYVTDCGVFGNNIDGSLYDGIRVFNGSRNMLYQNVITNSHRAENGSGSGILLEYNSSHNRIFSNSIIDETCVLAEAGLGVDYNSVSLIENSYDKVQLQGPNSTLLSSQTSRDIVVD